MISGRSGIGKSSLLYAGLIPRFVDDDYSYIAFREYTDPLQQLQEYLEQHQEQFTVNNLHSLSLSAILHNLKKQQHNQILILFDQFERFLVNVHESTRTSFIRELAQCFQSTLNAKETNFIFSIRREFWGQLLEEFEKQIPTFFTEIAVRYTLEPLNEDGARMAIMAPLEPVPNIAYDTSFIDDELLPHLIDQSKSDLQIEPAYLQIVCNALYNAARETLKSGEVVRIDKKLYQRLGETEGILHDYLDRTIAHIARGDADDETTIDEAKQSAVRSILKLMIESVGTRKFVSLPTLCHGLPDVTCEDIETAIRQLQNHRVIETRGQGDTATYSLSHEIMVDKVRNWFDERELERQKAVESLERGLAEYKNVGALLSKTQLKNIRTWVTEETIIVDKQVQALLSESEQAIKQQEKNIRWLRWLTRSFAIVLFIAIVIACIVLIWEQYRTANAQFEFYVNNAILLTKLEEYAGARENLNKSYQLSEFFIRQQRRRVRNIMAWFVDLMGGVSLETFDEAEAPLYSVDLSQDGRWMASVGEKGTILLYDLTHDTSPEYRRVYGLNGESVHENTTVNGVVFDPQGKWFATAGNDGKIILWSLPAAQESIILTSDVRSVRALAIHPEKPLLVSGGNSDAITVWDLASAKSIATLHGHDKGIAYFGLAFSPDGRFLASGSADKTAIIWDVEQQQPIYRLQGHTDSLNGLAFSPDGTLLATAGDDHYIRLWDVASGSPVRVFAGHTDQVVDLAFIEEGRRIISASMDRTIRLWDTASGVTLKIFQGHSAGVLHLATNGQNVFSASLDQTVKRWQTYIEHARQNIIILEMPDNLGLGRPISAAIMPDASGVAVGFLKGAVCLYTLPDFRRLGDCAVPEGENSEGVYSLAWNPDGTRLATASYDHTIRLWSINHNGHLQQKPGPEEFQNAGAKVVFSPNGNILASAGHDGRIGYFELGDTSFRFHSAGPDALRAVAFDPEGGRLVSAGDNDHLKMWDVSAWPPTLIQESENVQAQTFWAEFSPDGERIVSVGRDFHVHLLDSRTGRELSKLPGHRNTVLRASFGPDGHQLFTVGRDDTVRFWDIMPGAEKEVLSLPLPVDQDGGPLDFDIHCPVPSVSEELCRMIVPLGNRLVFYELQFSYEK